MLIVPEATCVCGHEADEHWASNACAVQGCSCIYYEADSDD